MRVLASAVAVAAWTAAEPAFAQGYPYPGHMWGGGWSMFFGPLWTTLLLALLIALIVGVVRAYRGGDGPRAGSAMRILEERFARGEINREEFEERRKALSPR